MAEQEIPLPKNPGKLEPGNGSAVRVEYHPADVLRRAFFAADHGEVERAEAFIRIASLMDALNVKRF